MMVDDRRLALSAALEEERGLDLVDPPAEEPAAAGELSQIAVALRAFQGLLTDEAVDRVVLVGSSNLALAAVLVATKMEIPVAAVEDQADEPEGNGSLAINRRLIAQLSDAALPKDATAVAAWVAKPQQRSQPHDEH